MAEIESGVSFIVPQPTPQEEFHWHLPSIAFNGLCCLVLISSIGAVVEIWLRKPNRWQFSLRGLCEFFALVAVVLSLYKHPYVIEGGILELGLSPSTLFQPWFGAPLELNAWAWATIVVVSCGVICSIWFLIHLASQAMYRLLKWVNPTRAYGSSHVLLPRLHRERRLAGAFENCRLAREALEAIAITSAYNGSSSIRNALRPVCSAAMSVRAAAAEQVEHVLAGPRRILHRPNREFDRLWRSNVPSAAD